MKKAFFTAVFLFLSISMSAQDIVRFVNNQLDTYPKLRLLDIYKSCFQDYMGAEHLVTDRGRVEAYLDEELKSITLDELLPWYYEPCGTEGNYVRVSIRAVKEGIVTKELLLDAFIRSANDSYHLSTNDRLVKDKHEADSERRPSVESWRDRWHEMIVAIDGMNLNLSHYTEDKQFIDSILTVGKYAISHSTEYREAYHPHYRIVERGIFEQEIQPLIKRESQGITSGQSP